MRVADLMQTDVRSIGPDAPISELVHLLADAHVSGLPVMDDGKRVIGVVSATDVLRAAAGITNGSGKPGAAGFNTVRDIMTEKPHMIEPDVEAREAAKQMLYADVRRLFVEHDGRLVGVISQTDIAQAVGTGRL